MKASLRPRPAIYPCPVLVVGSQDASGKPNLMPASWGGLSSMVPPMLSVSIRPETQTHANILETKAFTVSIPRARQARIIDLLGTTTGAKTDKFSQFGLTVKASKVAAPYAEEFPVVMKCEVAAVAELGSHTMFVGKIVGLLVDGKLTDGKTLPPMEVVDPLILSPSNYAYHGVDARPIGKAFRMYDQKKPNKVSLVVALLFILVSLVAAIAMSKGAFEIIGRAAAAGGFMTPR